MGCGENVEMSTLKSRVDGREDAISCTGAEDCGGKETWMGIAEATLCCTVDVEEVDWFDGVVGAFCCERDALLVPGIDLGPIGGCLTEADTGRFTSALGPLGALLGGAKDEDFEEEGVGFDRENV